jgi:tetratricopeptide (TPR) repeat protein
MRDFSAAIIAYTKAIRRDKDNFTANYRLGCVQIKNDMRDEGISSLKEALRIDPDDVGTLVKLGEIYAKDPRNIKDAE